MSTKSLSTFDLLDRMELMISEAKTIPLYNRIMLEKEEFTGLMKRVRDSIPTEMEQARQLVAMEQQILDESRISLASERKPVGLELLRPFDKDSTPLLNWSQLELNSAALFHRRDGVIAPYRSTPIIIPLQRRLACSASCLDENARNAALEIHEILADRRCLAERAGVPAAHEDRLVSRVFECLSF